MDLTAYEGTEKLANGDRFTTADCYTQPSKNSIHLSSDITTNANATAAEDTPAGPGNEGHPRVGEAAGQQTAAQLEPGHTVTPPRAGAGGGRAQEQGAVVQEDDEGAGSALVHEQVHEAVRGGDGPDKDVADGALALFGRPRALALAGVHRGGSSVSGGERPAQLRDGAEICRRRGGVVELVAAG